VRVTDSFLDVIEVLLSALREGDDELHGWAVMKAARRTGPTVYGVLDRLQDADWITSRWEQLPPEANRPRRRFYRLTPTGITASRALLAERRPEALRRVEAPRRPAHVRPVLGLDMTRVAGDAR